MGKNTGKKSQKEEQLRKVTQVFVEDASPDNPFGPNYKLLDKDTKIQYKYSLMKRYINLSPEDKKKKENEDYIFVLTLGAGIAAGFALGWVTNKLLTYFRPYLRGGSVLWVPITTGLCFNYAHKRYSEHVHHYTLDNYLKTAIENGFKDYPISESLG